MNLTNKILATIIASALAISVMVGVSLYLVTRSALQNSIATEHIKIAESTIDKVDRFLAERVNGISTASSDDAFEKVLSAKSPITAADSTLVHNRLATVAQYSGPWERLALVTKAGITRYTTVSSEVGEQIIGTHLSEADFARVLAGDIYYSDVTVDDRTLKPVLIFVAPVRDESSAARPVVGVIMGQLSWNTVLDILHASGGTYGVELFNKDGLELGDDKYLETEHEILQTDARNHPAIAAARAGRTGSGVFASIEGYDGSMLISYVPEKGFGAYQGNGWILTVQTPAATAFQGATNTALVASLIFALFVLIVSFLSYWLVRKLVLDPVLSLTHIAGLFAKHDFSQRFLVRSHDEVAKLGEAFNEMANSIQVSQAKLESRVQERTLELNQTNSLLKSTLDRVSQLAKTTDEQSALYQLMLASIGDAVLVADKNKTITIVNHVAEDLLGKKTPELVGQRVDSLVKFTFQDDTMRFEETQWNTAFAATSPTRLEIGINLLNLAGAVIPISVVISPIITRQGENIGAIITIRDVREERQLEETRISFISVASHQLRTPLTSMRWFSEMLLAGDAGQISEQQRHFVQRIYEGTDRMINLVSLLLQIARVEARRLKIEPVPTDLKHHTKGVALSLKPALDAKSQTVEIHSDPENLPLVPVDQEIIWQVIQNLLSNANRYAPEKGVITVNVVQKGDTLEYSVSDTGIGIPDSEKAKIFEKFYRAENALRHVPEGSGLGLSLVKSLVEGWGGKIWFDSKENVGTTFTFTIPVAGMQKREGDVSIVV